MRQEDTITLLKKCNEGIKMAVDAFDEVLPNVKDTHLKDILKGNKKEHEKLGDETHRMLYQLNEEPKDPNIIARGMSWMNTNVKMSLNPGDDTIADLICTGCDMGVRNLNKYINEYEGADQDAKALAKKIIHLEEDLSEQLRSYL